ncbi:hypothetical protein [Acidicapsa acidisoli]|nr:hypothetical protein [Acidicapsa acidisoli]
MNAMHPNQTVASMTPSHGDEEQHDKAGNFVYQAATILAIVLFLISF